MKRAMIADSTLDDLLEDADDASRRPVPFVSAPGAQSSLPQADGTADHSPAGRAFDFIPHQFGYPEPNGAPLLRADELLLWRFRAEWKELSRDQGYAHLSKAELARVRTHPNRALGKRFAVGRAMLREILASVTGIAPVALDLVDDLRGQPRLVASADMKHDTPISIALANAGVWILVGVAASSFGLDSVVMAQPSGRRVSAGGRITSSRSTPPALLAHLRAEVLQNCIEHASGERLAATDLTRLLEADAARSTGNTGAIELSPAVAWRTVELPMPDAICAAAAFSPTIARVHAFGWVGRDGRAIAGQAADLSI